MKSNDAITQKLTTRDDVCRNEIETDRDDEGGDDSGSKSEAENEGESDNQSDNEIDDDEVMLLLDEAGCSSAPSGSTTVGGRSLRLRFIQDKSVRYSDLNTLMAKMN